MKRHIFLTGEKGAGKSTLVRRLLAEQQGRLGGFFTVRSGEFICLLRAGTEDLPGEETRLFRRGLPADPGRFDLLGCRALERKDCALIVMDELGPHEENARLFQRAILGTLEGDVPVLGVLQRCDSPFIRRVAEHPGVMVVNVTEGNRDSLARELLAFSAKKGIITDNGGKRP